MGNRHDQTIKAFIKRYWRQKLMRKNSCSCYFRFIYWNQNSWVFFYRYGV